MSEAASISTKNLDQMMRALKGPIPTVRIGVLGKQNGRSNSNKTNAEIGVKHEFGLEGMPVRSFLRVPISDNLQKYLDQAGLNNRQVFLQTVRQGSFIVLLQKIGVVAESIVSDAFDTSGFGKWKTSNMARKKVKQTLVETQQLRNSISSEVK